MTRRGRDGDVIEDDDDQVDDVDSAVDDQTPASPETIAAARAHLQDLLGWSVSRRG